MNDTLTLSQLWALSPIIVTSLTAVLVMLAVAFKRVYHVAGTLTVIGLNVALGLTLWQVFGQQWHNPELVNQPFFGRLLGSLVAFEPVRISGGLVTLDSFAYFFHALILLAALACSTLSNAYLEHYRNNREELYILLLIAVTGALLLCGASHFASFFIGLELLSVPTYGLLAYTHERSQSLEASIKYMVLSAAMSGMMLMGMALLYAYSGSMGFTENAARLYDLAATGNLLMLSLILTGAAMIVTAMAFKLSLAPLHGWTSDVYQGAPAPVTTFLATVGKVAVAVVLIRYLVTSGVFLVPGIQQVLVVLAVASILVGNLLALRQPNLKRMLAYSSIAHMGYLMVAILVAGPLEAASPLLQRPTAVLPSAVFYLLIYTLISLGSFGVVSLMSSPYRKPADEAQDMADYRGLFWRRPVLASVMVVMLLALAGIPLTGGFIAKFMVLLETVDKSRWWLAAAVVLGSGMGLYYYLRAMVVLFMKEPAQIRTDAQHNWGVQAGGLMTLLVTALIIILGVYPFPALQLSALAQIAF